MEYRELLQQVEDIKHLPLLQRRAAVINLWREVLKATANGSLSADILARIALTVDVTDTPDRNN